MKKKVLATVLLSGMLVSLAPTAFAADAPADKSPDANGGGQTVHTEVEVELTEGGVDPTPGPFYKRLAIVWKPVKFQFKGNAGSTVLTNNTATKANQYIVVNDDRRDANDEDKFLNGNWKLSGKLSKLDNMDTGAGKQTELAGKMLFKPGKLENYDIGPLETKPDGSLDYVPASHIKDNPEAAQANYGFVNLNNQKFTLDAGGSDVVFLEKKGSLTDPSKRGVQTKLGESELDITNQKQEVGKYKGYITWTLATN